MVMVLSLALLVAQTVAPSPEPDLVVPSMSAPQALERLGEAVGETLTTDATFRDEFLIFRIKEVNGRETMAEVAEALDAVWERTEQGWRLTRNAQQKRRIEEARLEVFTKGLEESFSELEPGVRTAAELQQVYDELREAQENANWQSAEYRDRMLRLQAQTPEARLIARLAQAVGTDAFTQFLPGERRVYALNPTPVQYGLPASAAQAIELAKAELENMLLVERHGAMRGWRRGNVAPELFLFGLSSPVSGLFEATLMQFDANGSKLGSHTEQLANAFLWSPTGGVDQRFEGIEIDADHLRSWAMKILQGGIVRINEGPESEEDRSELTRLRNEARQQIIENSGPDVLTEPTSYLLLQAAQQLGRDLISVVPSQGSFFLVAGTFADLGSDANGTSEALYNLLQTTTYEIEITEDWISFDETNPQVSAFFPLKR
ncbi:MAG: hypothetical protein ACOCX1_04860, partial [Fimbriimonadaceae bacterium]